MLANGGLQIHTQKAGQTISEQNFANAGPASFSRDLNDTEQAIADKWKIGEKHTEQKQQQISQVFAQGGVPL